MKFRRGLHNPITTQQSLLHLEFKNSRDLRILGRGQGGERDRDFLIG